ncbi:MAG: hypothetical protein IIA59_01555 [Candidatus Marinimicrobia bacterium]|nr:hypothetical protein [Candidatus Neomarinimicrobiota bacterium]
MIIHFRQRHHSGLARSLRTLAAATILLGLVTVSSAQNLKVRPVAFAMYRSTGDWWIPESEPVQYMGAGIWGKYTWGKLAIESEFINARYSGLSSIPSRFNPEQGLSWDQKAFDRDDDFYADITTMLMSYTADNLVLRMGQHHLSWGPAYQSIFGSEKPPPVPRLSFEWRPLPWLRFYYDHSQLTSVLQDSLASAVAPAKYGARRVMRSRNRVAHRFEAQLPWGLTLAGAESVVYGDRGMDLIYMMPFISYWSAQHFLGDLDNTELSVDLTWEHASGWTVYGIFLMDEWTPELTFESLNRNWFGWQYGLTRTGLLQSADYFMVEGTWTDHRIYRHKFPVNDFYSHGYPVGHWAGPHAQSITALYQLSLGSGVGRVKFISARRGALTDEMIVSQYKTENYKRFSGGTETMQALRATFFWPVREETWFELGVSKIDWWNAGFDPADPAGITQDISKWSFNLGIYSNFHLTGYDISDLYR